VAAAMSPETAMDVVRALLWKYNATNLSEAKRALDNDFTQADRDTYLRAVKILDGNGLIG
jgi:hypothetical protein